MKITLENLTTLKRGDRFVFRSSHSFGTDLFATVTENRVPDEEQSGHLHFIEDLIPSTEFEFYYDELLNHANTTEILDEVNPNVESLISALPKRGRTL